MIYLFGLVRINTLFLCDGLQTFVGTYEHEYCNYILFRKYVDHTSVSGPEACS
jgi:hypothetical protein